MKINETQLYHGAVKQSKDSRDKVYDEEFIGGAVNINYSEGYDIRKEFNDDIDYLNQNQSYSCGGMMTAYQIWVYQVLEMMRKYNCDLKTLRIERPQEVEKISPKEIYSQVNLGYGGGSSMRDLGQHVTNVGALFNRDCPYQRSSGMTDEAWMIDKSWITPELQRKEAILQGKDYRYIPINGNMDLMANAIKENKGVMFGLYGINNGTWTSERPQPPTLADWMLRQNQIWGHFIWLGAFGEDEFGKFVATPNSWYPLPFQNGLKWTPSKPNGYGWQKLYQNYFDRISVETGIISNIFDPATFTDKLNNLNENDMIFKKEKNSPNIYAIVGNKKIMIVDMPTLDSYGDNVVTEVNSLSEYQDGGTWIWVDRIIN